MTGKKYTLTAANGEDMTMVITDFANSIDLEHLVPGRYSILLVLGLFGGATSNRLNPAKVVHEIQTLEGAGNPSRLKPPTQFEHPPLKGLWHKHYLEDGVGAIALNLKKRLKKYDQSFMQRMHETQETDEERYISLKNYSKSIANDVVHLNWMQLTKDAALTGQWIIYAQHKGKNYYLCLGTHDKSQHEDLRKQIDALCCQEFPFLSTLLAGA